MKYNVEAIRAYKKIVKHISSAIQAKKADAEARRKLEERYEDREITKDQYKKQLAALIENQETHDSRSKVQEELDKFSKRIDDIFIADMNSHNTQLRTLGEAGLKLTKSEVETLANSTDNLIDRRIISEYAKSQKYTIPSLNRSVDDFKAKMQDLNYTMFEKVHGESENGYFSNFFTNENAVKRLMVSRFGEIDVEETEKQDRGAKADLETAEKVIDLLTDKYDISNVFEAVKLISTISDEGTRAKLSEFRKEVERVEKDTFDIAKWKSAGTSLEGWNAALESGEVEESL